MTVDQEVLSVMDTLADCINGFSTPVGWSALKEERIELNVEPDKVLAQGRMHFRDGEGRQWRLTIEIPRGEIA